MDRRGQTTEVMRVAALDLLPETGPRALTLEGVAQRAFFSVGAVYQRWPDRAALLADLAQTRVLPALANLDGAADLPAWRESLLGSPNGRRDVLALAEVLFAARDDPGLVEPAREGAQALMASVPLVAGGPLGTALRWWLAGVALGDVLLERCGLSSPETAHALAPEAPSDTTTQALLGAVRTRLADAGHVSVRGAAADAGVTTGALYRRFPSRDSLLAQAIAEAGLGDSGRWLMPLLAALVEHGVPSPEADAAFEAAAEVASAAWRDPQSRDLVLESAVAAHTSEPVRAQLAARVLTLVESRSADLAALERAGALPSGMTALGLTWLLQTAPVGLRLLAAVGIEASDAEVQALVQLAAALALGVG